MIGSEFPRLPAVISLGNPGLIGLVAGSRPDPRQSAPTIDLDRPEAIAAATKWVTEYPDPAVEGDGGDATTYNVACRMLDFGLSVDAALDLMLDHWNDRCSPPWDADELRRKVENAERYRQAPVGSASAELEFDDVSDEVSARAASASSAATSEKASRWRTLPASEVARGALATTAYPLVQGLLNRNALSLFYGAPGQAKTFAAFVIAYCVAAGSAFAGRKVARGLVLYLLAEGGASYPKRVLALDKVHGIPADLPLVFLPISVNLRDRGELKSLLQAIREAEERAGLPCHLVVVDTLSRVLAGGDENSSTDMGEIIQNLDRLREKIGCHVLVIHHSGKDAARGARGHSLARAAVDTEIEVKDGELIVRKQRDLEFIAPLRFRLQSVELGTGVDGEPVTSAVARFDVEASQEFEHALDLHALTEREEQMLKAFDQAVQEKYGQEYQRGRREFYLSGPEWDTQMTKNLLVIGANDELSRQTFDAYRRKLTSKGAIGKGRRGQWFREK